VLWANDLGYRVQPTDRLSVDIAAFYNIYHRLCDYIYGEPTPMPGPVPYLLLAGINKNAMYGKTYGVELSVNFTATDHWRLAGGYTWLQMDLHGSERWVNKQCNVPKNQFNLRSYLDLPHGLEFDSYLYYVGNLANLNITGYIRLDVRLGWKAAKNLEISVGCQNLLDGKHQEYGNSALGELATEVERNFYLKVARRY
jgi:iron complex outermembrane receptor protein